MSSVPSMPNRRERAGTDLLPNNIVPNYRPPSSAHRLSHLHKNPNGIFHHQTRPYRRGPPPNTALPEKKVHSGQIQLKVEIKGDLFELYNYGDGDRALNIEKIYDLS